MHRKQFLSATLALSAAAIVPKQLFASDPASITIQQVIDLILKTIPGAPFRQTVDTVKAGDENEKLTGIVTTMFATISVIEAAAETGANFIIAHEPTFYNHQDETKWLENDTTYQYKMALLKKHKITVWRCHDYLHAHNPDGVMAGVLQAMGWEKYKKEDKRFVLRIPPATLQSIITAAKEKLSIQHVRYIGDMAQQCSHIVIIPGAAGGKTQIGTTSAEQPDLLIVGEVSEWETAEYIRDLRAAGGKTALLVLGHVVSEEAGLEWMAQWLRPQLPNVSITHMPSKDAFSWA